MMPRLSALSVYAGGFRSLYIDRLKTFNFGSKMYMF